MTAGPSFAHWPVPVGRTATRRGLTYVHAPGPGGFSAEEFQQVPDARVDLVDGVVVVRPALTPAQRQVVRGLYEQLRERCPKGLVVADGRRGVRAGPATVFRPDIQLVPDQPLPGGEGGTRPLLVVEARAERNLYTDESEAKRRGYRDVGIASYWVLDPDAASVTVYELRYIKRASYRSDEVCARGQRYWWGPWSTPE